MKLKRVLIGGLAILSLTIGTSLICLNHQEGMLLNFLGGIFVGMLILEDEE